MILDALICKLINSSLGILYGTILSPILIIVSFNPLLVIFSILFSQAIGGVTLKLERLDGDIVRQSLSKDLGFSKEDRDELIFL